MTALILTREVCEKYARRYPSASAAATALGVNSRSFRRACRGFEIEWRREWAEVGRGRKRRRHATLGSSSASKPVVGTSRNYFNICETEECLGFPRNSGFCIRCEAELYHKRDNR
jgi:hypothetical protein